MAEYTLRPGAKFNAIIKGEYVQLVGNAAGEVKVELTEEQTVAFADKFVETADLSKPVPVDTPEAAEEPAKPAAPAKK